MSVVVMGKGYQVDRLTGCQVDGLTGCQVDRSTGQLVNQPTQLVTFSPPQNNLAFVRRFLHSLTNVASNGVQKKSGSSIATVHPVCGRHRRPRVLCACARGDDLDSLHGK
jgi:hypothetical protein